MVYIARYFIIYIVFISLLLCCIKVFNFLVEVFENQKSFYVKSSLENEHQAKHIDTLLDEKLHLKYIPINTTFPNITE